jgi:phage baseplate assembly protein V
MLATLQQLARRTLNLLAIARLKVIDDTGPQQRMQVVIRDGAPDGLGEVIDQVPRLGEYGLAYSPPDGSEAVVIFLGGRRSAGVVVATGHRASRPKNLKPGEAMLYNGLTGASVKLAQDGTIKLLSGLGPSPTSITLHPDGTITSTGAWTHTGTFHATDKLSSAADVVDHTAADGSGGVSMKTHRDDYNVHKHGGVAAGAATSGVTDHPAT